MRGQKQRKIKTKCQAKTCTIQDIPNPYHIFNTIKNNNKKNKLPHKYWYEPIHQCQVSHSFLNNKSTKLKKKQDKINMKLFQK